MRQYSILYSLILVASGLSICPFSLSLAVSITPLLEAHVFVLNQTKVMPRRQLSLNERVCIVKHMHKLEYSIQV